MPPVVTRGRHNEQDRGRPDNQNKAGGGPVCYHCKKRGHFMAESQILEKKIIDHQIFWLL